MIVSMGERKDSENIESRLKENIRIHNARGIRNYKISMSVGIAYYDPENPVSFDELLVRADELMYDQKLVVKY
ncbi:MAG: two-component sensor kinase [Candidatus Scalindua rubra]|uniref:Two-component sensor kinase n=1 Tax=Candidatus Scalindua rubra TaxID=1872076 RepID=A0A1E3XA07_9BACT|nr:MAG: two-component sensor kinase [Candidatus Scalindua rubra]